jgi:hypothetical protein
LKQLATDITDPGAVRFRDLLTAANFSLVFRSLTEHQRMALSQQWSLPVLVDFDDGDSARTHGSGAKDSAPTKQPTDAATALADGDCQIQVEGFWPFWKDRASSVANDLGLDRMAILSGPNMGGKSTVLRSIASVTLLAHCGLYAPAAKARVASCDGLFLRMSGNDSPVRLSPLAFEPRLFA